MNEPQPEPVLHQYPYHVVYTAKHWLGFFCITGMPIALFLVARQNDRGLILEGIEMSAQNATIFYWVLCFLLSVVAVCSALGHVFLALSEKRIALTASGILMPERYSKKEGFIPYASIASLETGRTQAHRAEYVWLWLMLNNGKRRYIGQSLMPSKAAFDELTAIISAEVQKNTPGVTPV